KIVFHVLNHFQKETRQKRLCFAGGVAHNCTLNGKILYSGLFDEVFVQPAAHDAGSAFGSAISVFYDESSANRAQKLKHLFYGTEVGNGKGSENEIAATLKRWSEFLSFEKVDDIEARTAELLAEGSVVGWVQGRSEFGPRALGNRSILADPRPA